MNSFKGLTPPIEAIVANIMAIYPMGIPWLYERVNTKQVFSDTRLTRRIVPCLFVRRKITMREYKVRRGGAEADGEQEGSLVGL